MAKCMAKQCNLKVYADMLGIGFRANFLEP